MIKFLTAIFYPVGFAGLLVFISVALYFIGQRRFSRFCCLFALITILFFSIPIVAARIAGGLESQYPPVTNEKLEHHDAIVVLGGGLRVPGPPTERFQLGTLGDRYWYAFELYKAGKGGKIVLSGGNYYERENIKGEAFYAKKLLEQWGVVSEDIVYEAASKTTEQNMIGVSSLFQSNNMHSMILVTSALHMPRSMEIFSHLPLKVTPASADQVVRNEKSPAWKYVVPSAEALLLSTRSLHEYYGIFVYKLKNRISDLLRPH